MIQRVSNSILRISDSSSEETALKRRLVWDACTLLCLLKTYLKFPCIDSQVTPLTPRGWAPWGQGKLMRSPSPLELCLAHTFKLSLSGLETQAKASLRQGTPPRDTPHLRIDLLCSWALRQKWQLRVTNRVSEHTDLNTEHIAFPRKSAKPHHLHPTSCNSAELDLQVFYFPKPCVTSEPR